MTMRKGRCVLIPVRGKEGGVKWTHWQHHLKQSLLRSLINHSPGASSQHKGGKLCCSQPSLHLDPVGENLTKHIMDSSLPNYQTYRGFKHQHFPKPSDDPFHFYKWGGAPSMNFGNAITDRQTCFTLMFPVKLVNDVPSDTLNITHHRLINGTR